MRGSHPWIVLGISIYYYAQEIGSSERRLIILLQAETRGKNVHLAITLAAYLIYRHANLRMELRKKL